MSVISTITSDFCVIVITAYFLINLTKAVEWGELIVNDNKIANQWVKASHEFDDLFFTQRRVIIETLDHIVANPTSIGLSKSCTNSLHTLSIGLQQRKIWAYQFMDSSGKGKSGFTYGYIADYGNFDQCLGIKVSNGHREEFHGKYCMVNMRFPLTKQPERGFLRPMKLNLTATKLEDTIYQYYGNYTELFYYDTFTLGVCIPSTCSREELASMLRHTFRAYQLTIEPRKYCEDNNDLLEIFMRKSWDVKLSLIILFVLGSIVFWSTILNYFFPSLPYVNNFCAIRNTKKLTADYVDPSMKKLMFFDTFKCFFQLGGTLAHLILFIPVTPTMFGVIQDRSQDMRDLWILSELLQKSVYITQLVLIVSGFFTSYYIIPVIEKNKGQLNFLSFVFKRWLRTAPTLVAGIVCMLALSGIIYGPLAEEINEQYLNACRKTWLYTIFNLNNFHVSSDVCLPQTWTQSADFHLWIMSYLPLLWLYKNPRKGVISCLVVIAAGVIIPSVVVFVQDLPSPIGTARPFEILFNIMHSTTFPMIAKATYNNISNYFLGVLLGYICVKNIRFNLIHVAIFNIFSWVLIILCFFGPYIWFNMMGMEFNSLINAVYAGVFRLSFGLVFASCIYNAFYYSQYFIGFSVVETKAFAVFGRLAMSIYVSQLAPFGYYVTMAYDPVPINKYTAMLRVIPIVLQIYILGYFVFLLFEAPSLNFGKDLNFKSSSYRLEVNSNGHVKESRRKADDYNGKED